jgi:flagellar hook-basal body complex protein FliE
MAIAPIATSSAAPVTTAGMLQLSQGAAPAQIAQNTAQTAPLASFQQFFADAVNQTNGLQNQAEEAQKRLLIGESDDIHGVMIAMEKANMAFQLTLAVRNKVIDAYQEVMRMQI